MADLRIPRRRGGARQRLLVGAAAVVTVLLCAAAAVADGRGGQGQLAVLLDLAVGVCYVLAAAGPDVDRHQRLVLTAVGFSWLLGSVAPYVLTLHQGFLLLALAAFPTARLRGTAGVIVGVVGALVGFGLVPQLGACVAFGLVAGWAALPAGRLTGPRSAIGRSYAAVAASAVALSLLVATLDVIGASAGVTLYSVALILVALCHVPATRAAKRRSLGSINLLLDSAGSSVARLTTVLAGLLGDPLLRIDEEVGPGRPTVPDEPASYPVIDSGEVITVVRTRSASLTDPTIRQSVLDAVRMVVASERLRRQQTTLIAELDDSRRQLLATLDNERERMSEVLAGSVLPHLDKAASTLQTVRADDPEVGRLIATTRSELTLAREVVRRIVADAPFDSAGRGLADALQALIRGSALPVTATIAADARGDDAGEKALLYACSEALTNASKHSGASGLEVSLTTAAGSVVLEVGDNGNGRVDAHGHGLGGLADRLSAAGGRLEVHGGPGGTRLVATIPSVAEDHR